VRAVPAAAAAAGALALKVDAAGVGAEATAGGADGRVAPGRTTAAGRCVDRPYVVSYIRLLGGLARNLLPFLPEQPWPLS
jgi:hypothetical protein